MDFLGGLSHEVLSLGVEGEGRFAGMGEAAGEAMAQGRGRVTVGMVG